MPGTDPGRVLMTADAVGGVWTFAMGLARALAARGTSVCLAVLGPAPSGWQRAEALAIPGLELTHHGGALEWMEEPWADVAAAGHWLLDLERRVRPDVVHLNGYCHASLPWQSPVIVTGHSCVLSWWTAVHGTAAPPSWDFYAHETRRGLAAAGLVTAPSAAMLDMLSGHYGPLPRGRVILNGRALSTRPVPKEPFVLTAGRLWDPAKNVAAVCGAAPAMPWPVYVAGEREGPVARGVAACAGVRYLGQLAADDLTSWMARAAIYVLPARYEPFGLSVLEAALCECALVLGDIPSLREIWGDAAVFVPPDDVGALTSSVTALAADPPRRALLAARARDRARLLTPARMAASYCDAYAELTRDVRPLLSLGAV
jgi:glycosyltransferase involved in cell wall biosynthesis